MDHSQNVLVTLLAVLLCACVTEALPAARADGAMDRDLSHLVKLIGKLKNLNVQRNSAGTARGSTPGDSWDSVLDSEADSGSSSSSQALSTGPASSGAVSSSDKLAALKHGFLGFNKRQGAWSYDYGLGGGRFGKRYYGDYGIGGGRFGRDVDHVDIADTNDAAL